ncbi:hypothetical protein, partial [Proteus vulgaris]
DHATLATLAWNWSEMSLDSFATLLAAYAELVREMPGSDFSLLKLNHVAAGQIGMIYQSASPPGIGADEHR